MPYEKTLTAPGTCPICTGPRPTTEQITCAHCWWQQLNGKDRQELAAIHRQAGKNSDKACAPKLAKIARRLRAEVQETLASEIVKHRQACAAEEAAR